MIKALQIETMRITEEILRQLSVGEISFLEEYAADDIVALFPGEKRFCKGKKALLKQAASRGHAERLEQVHLESTFSARATTVISGSFHIRTPEVERLLLVSAIWYMDRKDLRLRHLVVTEGTMRPLIPEEDDRTKKPLIVRDVKGRTWTIPSHAILYIKADRNYVEIYRTDGDVIRVRDTLSRFRSGLNEDFIILDRSCSINILHVRVVHSGGLILSNQEEIPITKRTHALLRRKMRAYTAAREL